MTYFQLQVWEAYFELEWNTPERGDYYLMAIRKEIFDFRQMFAKNAHNSDLEEFKVEFTFRNVVTMTPEQRAAISKARYMGATGYSEKRVEVDSARTRQVGPVPSGR